VACFCSLYLANYPSKLALFGSHLLTVASALLFTLLGQEQETSMHIICLFLCRFGVTLAFNCSYTIMRELFPTLVRATSFGICNVCARLITISAPVFARANQPIPMLIVVVFSGCAAGLTLLLRPMVVNYESTSATADVELKE
jgi:hypothetical protein